MKDNIKKMKKQTTDWEKHLLKSTCIPVADSF